MTSLVLTILAPFRRLQRLWDPSYEDMLGDFGRLQTRMNKLIAKRRRQSAGCRKTAQAIVRKAEACDAEAGRAERLTQRLREFTD